MTSDEIRESFLAFFEERGHLRIPSASLVPSAHDPSALLTVAGMHPLKPYFLGEETPPAPRLTSCQKSFRTIDIDRVGDTTRHLTFFEMLGNFSFGDYFKREAIAFAWELSREVFGLAGEDIWVTVFAGDDELGLGPDEEAIEIWMSVGVPRERIVECPRSENFWQAGPTGPSGPSSELYLDRGLRFGSADDLPGGENERFLEYWNLVFTEYDLLPTPPGERQRLAPLPARNIDTGLGLNRMAAILQGKDSVFETDQFWPLIELGQELSGRSYGEESSGDRALRILADHSRAATFLIADGVVPSNEDRGYVLRRVMRRAIQQGRSLAMEPGFMTRYGERVRELMAAAYPELSEQWTRDRTLAGLRGGELRAHARPGQPPARGPDRPRRGAGVHDDRGQRRFHAPRHLRLPLRGHPRARRRARPRGRGRELCRADGRPARPRPRRRRRRRRRRRVSASRPASSPRRRACRRASPAMRRRTN